MSVEESAAWPEASGAGAVVRGPGESARVAPGRPRATLAKLMALNVGVAAVLAAARLELATLGVVLATVWGAFLVVLLVHVPLDAMLGVACPRCGRRGLRRLALPFRVATYYACLACGARCKRSLPFSPWRDASSPDDEPHYRPKSSRGNWLGYAPPVCGDSTCGRLLTRKRLRDSRRAVAGDDLPNVPYPDRFAPRRCRDGPHPGG